MRVGLGLGLTSQQAQKQGGLDLPTRYMFIDGASLQKSIDKFIDRLSENGITARIDYKRIFQGAERYFYYDSLPSQRNNESASEFAKKEAEKEAFFYDISRFENVSVRRALTRRSKKQDQKGADILLAVDCLTHAMRGNIDQAIIVANDLDFFPLLESLMQTKTRSQLIFDPDHTSKELISCADHSIILGSQKMMTWLYGDTITQLRSDNLRGEDRDAMKPTRKGFIEGVRVEILASPQKNLFKARYIDERRGENWRSEGSAFYIEFLAIGEAEARFNGKFQECDL